MGEGGDLGSGAEPGPALSLGAGGTRGRPARQPRPRGLRAGARRSAYPAGATPTGVGGLLGDVWEWTASHFDGYPGFAPHPYPQYSQVFFGQGYRVLRGGSWATRTRVATPTFRNWDLPQRRQIFSGFRIAQDLA